jgi:hypothetical protein
MERHSATIIITRANRKSTPQTRHWRTLFNCQIIAPRRGTREPLACREFD